MLRLHLLPNHAFVVLDFGAKPLSRDKYVNLSNKLAEMCIKDLRPLSMVEGEGFRNFCHAMNPLYTVPCRTTIKNYVDKQYDEQKEELISALSDEPSIAFTTDMWTSVATEGYITVTGHYINDNFEMNNVMLATRELEERHTGENIGNELLSIKVEFNIDELVAMTTDNASNMDLAAKTAATDRIKCFAHTLQLAIHEGLDIKSISNLIMHTRKLVAFFSKSVLATKALEKHQCQLGKPKKHCITDVQTRWNSSFLMFERLLLVKADVISVLENPIFTKHQHLLLKDHQWELMKVLVPALKPLAVATEMLAIEEYPSSSGYYPLVFKLLTHELVSSEMDSKVIAEFKGKVSMGLEKRLFPEKAGQSWLKSPLMIATILDPQFKKLKFLTNENDKKTAYSKIVQLMVSLDSAAETSATVTVKPDPDPEPVEPPTKKSLVSSLLADYIEIDDDEQPHDGPEAELDLYLASRAGSIPALVWWRQNKNQYPRLAQLARKYLAIPATSVPSERAFSTAGLTITKQRARLSPENADKIIFLNKNFRRFHTGKQASGDSGQIVTQCAVSIKAEPVSGFQEMTQIKHAGSQHGQMDPGFENPVQMAVMAPAPPLPSLPQIDTDYTDHDTPVFDLKKER